MKNACSLSINTTKYIEQYQSILQEMIEKMSCAERTQSISGNFIVQMLPHHRAAIEMSKNLLQYTTNVPLQNIALNIISAQTRSIENLTAACSRCQTLCNSPQDLAEYQRKNEEILETMFHDMKCACTDNCIDANFMREMIPHHEGAVRMSENALCYPVCRELVPILDAIITSQKRGIRQMRALQKQMGCQ